MAVTSPVMRYHGAKWRMAPWIISHFPSPAHYDVYTEAYGGSAGVLIRAPRTQHEVYNDLDSNIVNVFRVLRDPWKAQQLARLCRLTPYSRDEFERAAESHSDPIEQARRTLFRASAGFGSAAATAKTCGFRTFTGESCPHGRIAGTWIAYQKAISDFTERLQGVAIESRPALEILRQHDRDRALHYIDPPYMPDTRSAHGSVYRHEMTAADHVDLLETLTRLEGYVLLSGYDSELYRDTLADWMIVTTDVPASSNAGTVSRTECLWLSPRAAKDQRQRDMFA